MSVGVSSLDNCKTDCSIIIFCADKYDGRGYVIYTPNDCCSYSVYVTVHNIINYFSALTVFRVRH